MEFTSEFLKEKFNEYNEKYFGGRVPYVDLEWNNRTTATGGSCYYDIEGNPYKIDISSKYIGMFPEEMRNIMVHEMIHVLLPKAGHGDKFIKEMERLNNEFPELQIGICGKKGKYYWRYIYECSHCERTFKVARRIPRGYICAKCYGEIKLIYDNQK